MLDQLFDGIRDRGCSLGLTGGPGIGKSALLAEAAERAAERGMLVLRATGVQSEALQAFAGLHQLLRPVLSYLDGLPAPQRDAIQAAFGLADGPTPDLFLTALAALDLLADSAARAPVLVAADDVQWLDRPTRDVLAFVARRLEFEPVLLITAVLDGYPSPLDAGQQALHLDALPSAAAAALLDARAPGLPEAVRARLLDEAAGNPLALVELPAGLGIGATVARWLPLTRRLERAFAARAFDLPAPTRTALLVAALDDSPLLSEVLAATALLIGKVSPLDVLAPAVDTRLIETDGTNVSFRHPLIRTAIRQEASISQRHAAHAALASILNAQPERQVWHRAASITGPDETVAAAMEVAAAQAKRRGGTAVAVAALRRAADLGDGLQRPRRLLDAAELAFELGQHDLVRDLLEEAEPLGLSSREQARLTWIRESFGDGVPGAAASTRLLAAAAGHASADGDTDLALKLLNGVAQRCWWAEPGQVARDHVVATAERLEIAESDPRLLVILAFAAPVERGAVVIDRLSRLLPTAEPGTGAVRLAAIAATAVGAFDLAVSLLAASMPSLRAQGRLGLLARALTLQAWSAAQLADLGTAIPAAEEARRLAEETSQPLIMATAEAVQAILAALRGQHEAAEALAAQAERVSVPAGASAIMAAALQARGLAALGAGRPADALALLRRVHDRADPAFHTGIRCHTIGTLAEAAVRSGDPHSIDAYMQEMETAAQQTPSPSLHAGLRYARALLAPATRAGTLFEDAMRSESSAWSFIRARVQLAYGERLHQERQDSAARAPLRAATDAFDALGVIPWSDRARQQLRATGEKSRPRTPEARDQLTPQELQIVQMAAEGMTNREIGQKLYLSHRTVGSHLYRVFPKLGISSRTELRAALSARLPSLSTGQPSLACTASPSFADRLADRA
jgi:DNA-binding CsgD family transcriptional regulator